MKQVLRYATGAALAVFGMGQTAHADEVFYKGYDLPPHQVVTRDGAFEHRRYLGHLSAEVVVDGSRAAAIRQGFRILAGYIFGGNATGQKVAMTVPVTQVPDDAAWIVRFMMPPSQNRDSLPQPNNGSIRFAQIAPQDHLVLRFTGPTGTSRLMAQREALLAYARDHGATPSGPAQYHFYDDPFTLPWNRRTEVSVPIEPGLWTCLLYTSDAADQ